MQRCFWLKVGITCCSEGAQGKSHCTLDNKRPLLEARYQVIGGTCSLTSCCRSLCSYPVHCSQGLSQADTVRNMMLEQMVLWFDPGAGFLPQKKCHHCFCFLPLRQGQLNYSNRTQNGAFSVFSGLFSPLSVWPQARLSKNPQCILKILFLALVFEQHCR